MFVLDPVSLPSYLDNSRYICCICLIILHHKLSKSGHTNYIFQHHTITIDRGQWCASYTSRQLKVPNKIKEEVRAIKNKMEEYAREPW